MSIIIPLKVAFAQSRGVLARERLLAEGFHFRYGVTVTIKVLLIVDTSPLIDELGRGALTHSLTYLLTHLLTYLLTHSSDNNVKIDQSVIDKYSHDSKNSTDTVDVAVNSKNSLLTNMLLGGNDK